VPGVLQVHLADHPLDLLPLLVEGLSEPTEDVFAKDWVVVPSLGVRAWLKQQLSRELGSSRSGRHDGVAANIDFPFPGRLRWTILRAATAAEQGSEVVEDDPWQEERLVWSVLEVLQVPVDGLDERLFSTEGTSLAARAQSIARLFDSYNVHRAGMVEAWADGHDVGASGGSIATDQVWQPELYRRVHRLVVERSGVERLPSVRLAQALERVRSGELAVAEPGGGWLPSRLFVFGQSTWGADTGPVLAALAEHRLVRAFVPSPSASTSIRLAAATTERAAPGALTWSSPRLAANGVTDLAGAASPGAAGEPLSWPGVERLDPPVDHPLLASWGRRPLETALLLGAGAVVPVVRSSDSPSGEVATVLGSLQAGVRAGRAVDGAAPGSVEPDRTLQIHGAPGRTRQVEVLRDVICDLLEHGLDQGDGSPVELAEADIAVVCHQLDEFAPIIGSVWGPPASGPFVPAGPDEEPVTPTLRYSIVDRTPRETNPVLDGLATLLELVGGRMERSAVVGFLSLPAVGNRFGLGPEERELLSSWVDQAGVRWGLDGAHRARSVGLPEEFDTNTWAAGLRQLVAGVASGEPLRLADVPGTSASPVDEFDLALGSTAITTVPDGQIQAAARVVDAVCTLADVVEDLSAERVRTVAEWRDLLVGCVGRLLAPDRFADWQSLKVVRILGDLVAASGTPHQPDDADAIPDSSGSEIAVTLGDLRRLVGPSFRGSGVRADLGLGAIAVARPSQLAAVPYRVVCVLGLDAGALPVGGRSGDDLGAEFPLVGDRDVRSEARAELLAALTTTTDAFVVTFTSHDIRTNASVPRSAVLDELVEAVETLGVEPERLVRLHPRQSYDPSNFPPAADGRTESGFRSFDAEAERAAKVVQERRSAGFTGDHGELFVTEPLGYEQPDSVQLEALHRFHRSPAARFLRDRLAVAMGSNDSGSGDVSDELPLELGGLDAAAFGRALFDAVVRAGSPDDLRYERPDRPTDLVQRAVDLSAARGGLPLAPIAAVEVQRVAAEVAGLVDAAVAAGFQLGPTTEVQIDVGVAVGGSGAGSRSTQLIGVVTRCSPAGTDGRPGPVVVEFSRPKWSRLFQRALDLLALTAQDPSTPWRSLQVTRGEKPRNGGIAPPAVNVLSVRGAEPSDRRSAALSALGSVLGQFTDGHRAPLLWFPETSAAYALGGDGAYQAAAKKWGDPSDSSDFGSGECEDVAVRVLFGDLTFDELVDLDAAGSTFAEEVERSWGAVLAAVDGLVDGGTGS